MSQLKKKKSMHNGNTTRMLQDTGFVMICYAASLEK